MDDIADKIQETVDRINKFLKADGYKAGISVLYSGVLRKTRYSETHIVVLAKRVRFGSAKEFGVFRNGIKDGMSHQDINYVPSMKNTFGGNWIDRGERVFSLSKPHDYYDGKTVSGDAYFRGNRTDLTMKDRKARKGYSSRNMFDYDRPISMEIMIRDCVNIVYGYVNEQALFEKAYQFGSDFAADRPVITGRFFDWLAERRLGRVVWDEVGGMDGAKLALEENTIMIDENPDIFADEERDHILLVGPPGVGKTILIKAMMWRLYEMANILPYVDVARYLGIRGEEAPTDATTYLLNFLNTLYKHTGRWTYLFVDEIDSIGKENTQAKALLREMDNVGSRKFSILAATNRPDLMDFALFRPGRFGSIIFVDFPKAGDRQAIWGVASIKYDLGLSSRVIAGLVKSTDKFTGADIMYVGKVAQRKKKIAVKKGERFDHVVYIETTLRSMRAETIKKNSAWRQRILGFVAESEATVMFV